MKSSVTLAYEARQLRRARRHAHPHRSLRLIPKTENPMITIERVQLLKDMIQQAVDRGASSVEQIHQYIADLPFEALEKSGLLEEDKMGLREKKTRTIGTVYNAIRKINQQIGDLISDQLENLEDAQHVSKVIKDKEPTKS
jgi:hypothetical protein